MPNVSDSSAPELNIMQFDSGGVSTNGVNLYRGSLSFPLNLMTLPGLGGLALKINLMYESDVQTQVDKWNAEAQTDITGLGWSLPYGRIFMMPQLSGSTSGSIYYLVDSGQPQKLIPIPTAWALGNITTTQAELKAGKPSHGIIASLKALNIHIAPSATLKRAKTNTEWLLKDHENELSYKLKMVGDKVGDKVEVLTDGLCFELENYRFWQITYYPEYEKWVIVKEDGSQYSYGGTGTSLRQHQEPNVLQWGIKWNNWVGNSTQGQNQQRYVVAWNLESVKNVFGNYQVYNYYAVEQTVGSGQLTYTKECHVLEVQNDLGWSCIYSYKPMTYDNSALDAPKEYIDPCGDPTKVPDLTPNAHQSRYITVYLDKISVLDPANETPLYLQFDYYDLQNLTEKNSKSNAGLLAYGGTYKRYLKSITQYCADGETKPGIEFFYNFTKDTSENRGALNKILYPTGGSDVFSYDQVQIGGDEGQDLAGRNITIKNPFGNQSNKPRIWYGTDYVVCGWYNDDSHQLKVNVFTWVGRWHQTFDEWITFQGQIDLDEVQVFPSKDTFILALNYIGNNQSNIYLFNRKYLCKADWVQSATKYSYDTHLVNISSGNDFYILNDQDNNVVDRLTWNWSKRDWDVARISAQADLCQTSCGEKYKYYVTAYNNYYIIMCYCYGGDTKLSKFSIFYTNGLIDNTNNITWIAGGTLNTDLIRFPGLTTPTGYFNFGPSDSFASIAYITGYTQSSSPSFNYEMQILSWDENFNNMRFEVINGLDPSTFKNITASVENFVGPLVANNSLVGSGPNFFFYDGVKWSAGNLGLKWNGGFSNLNVQYYWYAYAKDILLQTENTDSGIYTQLCYRDLNIPNSNWQKADTTLSPPPALGVRARRGYPTLAAGTYMTYGKMVGNEFRYFVYNRSVYPNWDQIDDYILTELSDPNIDTTTIINQAPYFIAYMTVDSNNQPLNTQVLYFRNGDVIRDHNGNPIVETLIENSKNQQITRLLDSEYHYRFSYEGLFSAIPQGFMTFPVSDQIYGATEITLHHYSNESMYNPIKTFVVRSVTSDSGYQKFFKCYVYDAPSAAQDVSGTIIKFQQATEYLGCIDPKDQKDGYTVSYFYNGLPSAPVTLKGLKLGSFAATCYSMLDGMLIAKEQYDASHKLVSNSEYHWDVATQVSIDAAGRHLRNIYGGIAQATSTTTMVDGIATSTYTTYSIASGCPITTQSSYFGSAGEEITKIVNYTYAFEKYNEIWQRNILNAVALTQVQTKTSSKPNLITQSMDVQTYKKWSFPQNSGVNFWGTFERFGATSATAPDFIWWDGSQSSSEWLKTNAIISRDDQGNIIESADAENTISTVLYENDEKFPIASFVNATIEDNGICYDSFEDYQHAGWTFSNPSGGNIIATDSFTGKCCFNATATGNLTKTIQIKDLTRSYVLGCWLKTNSGADKSQISITLVATDTSTKKTISKSLELSDGHWSYNQWVIDLSSIASSGSFIEFNIGITIQGSNQFVRVDDIAFMPLECGFSATVYDHVKMRATATLAPNGVCNRRFYNNFYSTIGTTGSFDNPLGFSTAFLTRQTTVINETTAFPTSTPNSTVMIGGQNQGFFDEFKEDALDSYTFINCSQSDWKVGDNTLSLLRPSTAPLGAQVRRSDFQADDIGIYALVDSSASNVISMGTGKVYVLWNQSKWQLCTLLNNVLTVVQEVTNIGFQREWILAVFDSRLMFLANGILIFNYYFSNLSKNHIDIGMQQPGSFSQLIVAEDIDLSIIFSDGLGRTLQTLNIESANSVILGTSLYDYLGRQAITLKPARITTAQVQNPLAYYDNYITNGGPDDDIWDGKPLQGPAAAYFPECGGYPFSRQVYEASPLQRPIQIGAPGIDFAITGQNTHITTIEYSKNEEDPGFLYPLPVGQYYVTKTKDPDGVISTSYVDLAENHIGVIQSHSLTTQSIKSSWVYDENDRLIAVIPAAYYEKNKTLPNPVVIPTEASVVTYDFLGRKSTSSNPDSGDERYIYDNSSLVRFFQDDTAKAKGYINYIKYDSLGRVTEDGYHSCAWDPVTLQYYANTDPTWPSSETWSHKCLYDGDDTTPNMIGNLWKGFSHNNTAEDVTEVFTYNKQSKILSTTCLVSDYNSSQEHTISYDYNCIGAPLTCTDSRTGLTVTKSYNRLKQLLGVFAKARNTITKLASYTYTPDGRIESASFLPSASTPLIDRAYTYNSMWLDTIQDGNVTEKLQYTQGSCDKSGYYSGVIANQAIEYTSGQKATDQYCFTVDLLKRLVSANNQTETNLWTMDDNSNISTHIKNGITNTYTLFANTNKLQAVTASDGSVHKSYDYTEDGKIKTITDAATGTVRFNYYNGNGLPQTVSIPNNPSADQLSFQYSTGNKRVLKTKSLAGKTVWQRLYIHGVSSMPTLEIDQENGLEQVKRFIYVPGATIIFYKDKFFFVLKDHLGSPRVVIDQDNHVVGQYNYDVYGMPTIIQDPEFAFDYLYTFQEYERDFQFYNYKLRFYDPSIGRFLMPDPAGEFFSGYVYVGGNPIMAADPTGAMSIGAIFGIIAGSLLVTASAIATIASMGAATPLLTESILLDTAIIGAAIGAGTSSISYSATHQDDWSAKDWATSVGIGAASGAAAGAAGYGLGVAAGAATGALLGEGASTAAQVTAATLGGAAVGAASNVVGALVANGLSGNSLDSGLGAAAWQGAVMGAIAGFIGGTLAVREKSSNLERGKSRPRSPRRDRIRARRTDRFREHSLSRHKVYSSTGRSTYRGVRDVLRNIPRGQHKTLVLTGTHGTAYGETAAEDSYLAERDFFREDQRTAKRRGSVDVVDVDRSKLTSSEVDNAIENGRFDGEQYDRVILGFCYGEVRYNNVFGLDPERIGGYSA